MGGKELLALVIATVIVAVIWISADIYRSTNNVSISPKLQHALQPLNPNFDQETLDKINQINQTASTNEVSTQSANQQ